VRRALYPPQLGVYSLWDDHFARRVDTEGAYGLYDTLEQVLRQHQNRVDCRYLKTLAWMIVRLMQAKAVRRTGWTPYLQRLAVYAQSRVGRLGGWLLNKPISAA
jgi:hypothetical protein